jgi:hypothetical protein
MIRPALAGAAIAAFACCAPIEAARSSPVATPAARLARSTQGAGLERAIANYEALARGEKRLTDLSPIEQEELAELRALLRAARPRIRDTRDACIARETAARGGTLTMLEERVVDLICSQH